MEERRLVHLLLLACGTWNASQYCSFRNGHKFVFAGSRILCPQLQADKVRGECLTGVYVFDWNQLNYRDGAVTVDTFNNTI